MTDQQDHDDDRAEVDAISLVICEAVVKYAGEHEPVELETVIEALLEAITIHLSFECPHCRKRITQNIKRAIPGMLKRAAEYEEQETQAPSMACH